MTTTGNRHLTKKGFPFDKCAGGPGPCIGTAPSWTLLDSAVAESGGCEEIAFACDRHLPHVIRALGVTDETRGDHAVVVPITEA